MNPYHQPYPQNDQTAPTLSIPVQLSTLSSSTPTPIPVQYPNSTLNTAASKIQTRYRSHLIRALTHQLLSINFQANLLQRKIQLQETVDSVRKDEKERLRLSENLMGLLLKLDSVPGGFDPNVRDARRRISRRIVELMEILDGIVKEEVDGGGFEGMMPGSCEEFWEKIWVGAENDDGGCAGGNGSERRRRFKCCLEEFVMGM